MIDFSFHFPLGLPLSRGFFSPSPFRFFLPRVQTYITYSPSLCRTLAGSHSDNSFCSSDDWFTFGSPRTASSIEVCRRHFKCQPECFQIVLRYLTRKVVLNVVRYPLLLLLLRSRADDRSQFLPHELRGAAGVPTQLVIDRITGRQRPGVLRVPRP